MDPEQDSKQAANKPSKGYGKRPMWQWVLIYIIAAIVVYGLIYLIFFKSSGTSY